MNHSFRQNQSGFTLLEVMVATVILGVGLATISGTVATTVRSTSLATGYESARVLAESQLAIFLASTPLTAGKKDGEQGNATWQITATENTEIPNLIDINIQVEFFATGGTRTVELVTAELIREKSSD